MKAFGKMNNTYQEYKSKSRYYAKKAQRLLFKSRYVILANINTINSNNKLEYGYYINNRLANEHIPYTKNPAFCPIHGFKTITLDDSLKRSCIISPHDLLFTRIELDKYISKAPNSEIRKVMRAGVFKASRIHPNRVFMIVDNFENKPLVFKN